MILHGNNCAMNSPTDHASAQRTAAHSLLTIAEADADRRNAAALPEGERAVEAMVAALDAIAGLSADDRLAITFGFRMAYWHGKADGGDGKADLLAALQPIVHPDNERIVYFVPSDAHAMKLLDEARAAIARATGATP